MRLSRRMGHRISIVALALWLLAGEGSTRCYPAGLCCLLLKGNVCGQPSFPCLSDGSRSCRLKWARLSGGFLMMEGSVGANRSHKALLATTGGQESDLLWPSIRYL